MATNYISKEPMNSELWEQNIKSGMKAGRFKTREEAEAYLSSKYKKTAGGGGYRPKAKSKTLAEKISEGLTEKKRRISLGID